MDAEHGYLTLTVGFLEGSLSLKRHTNQYSTTTPLQQALTTCTSLTHSFLAKLKLNTIPQCLLRPKLPSPPLEVNF